jgi:flagellar hook assembly protein FlgD
LNVLPDSLKWSLDEFYATGFIVVAKSGVTPKLVGKMLNYPNPFRTTTTISFSLSHFDHVSIRVYNIFGDVVFTLIDQELSVGVHSVTLDASTLSKGIYYYTFKTASSVETKRLVLVK